MKRLGFALMVMLAVVSLVIAGCGGDDDEEATPTATAPPGKTATPTATEMPGETPTATEMPGETPTPIATQPSGDSLSDILGGMLGVESVKYDMVMEGPGMPSVTSTVWLKPEKGMKTESIVQGTTSIMLIDYDAQTMYTYMPAQNMAIKMPFGEAPESALEGAEYMEQYSPVVTGTETIDGKSCWVIEYSAEGVGTKMWVWKDKKFPVRMEATTSEGTMKIEYKNIDFGSIADSIFELPAGVEIMEIPS